jgi:hypothetical protein
MADKSVAETEKVDLQARKVAKLNSLGMSPGGGIMQTCLMLWMCGSEIQMFSIMMLGMALSSPFKALANVSAVFAQFENDASVKSELFRAKLLYVALTLLSLGVALAKLHFMGLLPTAAVDWMDDVPAVYGDVTSAHFI